MKYLLDVNALMAWIHSVPAEHHARLHKWHAAAGRPELNTCAISELGFLRITMAQYGFTAEAAQKLLDGIKRGAAGYIDTTPPPRMARWVLSHRHTTDAYLCQLAVAHGMKLATFDEGIKDSAAFLIP